MKTDIYKKTHRLTLKERLKGTWKWSVTLALAANEY